MKKIKHGWLGHMVKIVKSDPWTNARGEVVCWVREKRHKEYIVQFTNTWSYFTTKEMKLDE